MKIYKNKKECKSKRWSIYLREEINSVFLLAIDDDTGRPLATLIDFETSGRVYCSTGAKDILLVQGYNPYQWKNEWNHDGSIKIN